MERLGVNELVGLETPPEFIIPIDGLYLWEHFTNANDAIDRIREGFCNRISPAEWLAWGQLNGYLINSQEWQILFAMDKQYCTETNADIIASREKAKDTTQQDTGAKKYGR